ncbi:sulfurtransferase complex subunit TusD [Marinobacterium arenosum]|uniref:sulfurtransferase complex subunit TusD n=1 Tax=Marinobacterium arenosum TaxID=2862496 RepID=UPI001C94EB32|nr:sulfurtransferase complex subunit TusD [Marinobacterium arenosum]MBY4677194.1 sulfurtransferase complex subunit TusD [Marinobacterium arenosum]
MIFTIVVQGAPHSQQSADSALRFAEAALAAGHQIHRVFFSGDGVHNGSDLATPQQDERHLPRGWQALVEKHQLDLVVCIAAAIRRGVMNDAEARRHDKAHGNLADGFNLSGLGQLAEAALVSDRVLTFGQ